MWAVTAPVGPFGHEGQHGYYPDSETGLLLLTNRYLDVGTGRFVTRDPISYAGGPNLYAYVSNGPLTSIDPFGLCGEQPDGIADLLAGFDAFWKGVNRVGDGLEVGINVAGSLNPLTSAGLAANDAGEGDYTSAGLGLLPGVGSVSRPAGRVAQKALPGRVLKALPVGQRWNAGNFARNLEKLTGAKPAGAQTHHVFPQQFEDRFRALGFDIHDPRFGTWWPAQDHLNNAYRYNEEWRRFLNTGPTSQEVMDFGRQIMQRYGFRVNF